MQRTYLAVLAAVTLTVVPVRAGDGYCPAYPAEKALIFEKAAEAEQAYAARRLAPGGARAQMVSHPRANRIDDHIFGRMEADGVAAAGLASDGEFLRRLTLDMTGQLPTPEEVEAFLADGSPDKRSAAVNRLLASPAYVSNFTKFLADRFEVTAGYYNYVSATGRNAFYEHLREFVAADRSYRSLAVELITATGDTIEQPATNYLMRAIQQGDPVQDTWDTLTDRITTQFLGVQTQCVSCHDGEYHLEQINHYLTGRTRQEFMQLSAYLSRMRILELPMDAEQDQTLGVISDGEAGGYHGRVDNGNPGQRPMREGGPYAPRYFFTGREAGGDAWRREFAAALVSDRQFARAAVNYLWAHFFVRGIVDPPDAWDLARIDPDNPPPAPWTLQPSHPELLEELADEFIRSGFRLRPVIRLIASSTAYQLSADYTGEWQPAYTSYFARRIPRRMRAEEVYDAFATATGIRRPLRVTGYSEPVYRAVDLPDALEPWQEYDVHFFLDQFGRGNWWEERPTDKTSVTQTLFLMNSYLTNYQTFGNSMGVGGSRVARLTASDTSREQAARELFLATLSRPPTNDELATLLAHQAPNREVWLSDVLWALLNRTEFLFNH